MIINVFLLVIFLTSSSLFSLFYKQLQKTGAIIKETDLQSCMDDLSARCKWPLKFSYKNVNTDFF